MACDAVRYSTSLFLIWKIEEHGFSQWTPKNKKKQNFSETQRPPTTDHQQKPQTHQQNNGIGISTHTPELWNHPPPINPESVIQNKTTTKPKSSNTDPN